MTAPKHISPFRARYGAALVVGSVTFAALVVVDPIMGWLSVKNATLLDTGIRSALFGALVSVAGIFLTVLLAVLAVVTSLDDDRPVVSLMKTEMKNYDELIHRLVGPVRSVMIVAVLSIACLVIPRSAVAGDAWWTMILPGVALSLALGVFVQTGAVARLLGKVLLFKSRRPDELDTASAARDRLENRLEQPPPGPEPARPPQPEKLSKKKKRLQRVAAVS